MGSITENLLTVRQHIAELSEQCNRAGQVRLLAVSKTFPTTDIQEAFSVGQLCFGENRVQELAIKVPGLPSSIEWHLIGQLQTNKVMRAVELADWIHSVDSLRLLKKIAAATFKRTQPLHILLEVNSGEENKAGFRSSDELKGSIEFALNCPGIILSGLMTMAPIGIQDTELHHIFANLRDLRDRLQTQFGIKLPELSMGMSGDYPQAIQEGATIVRIGTAIFGGR